METNEREQTDYREQTGQLPAPGRAGASRLIVGKDKRRFLDVALSSDAPDSRFGMTEVLEHTEAAIDTSRVDAGLMPFLADHNQREQLGIYRLSLIHI